MQIAEHWYEREELEHDTIRMRESHVNSFARCNIWLVRGTERDLLIDSGTGLQPLRPALAARLGWPVIAVATHIHFDHVGALHEFTDRRAHSSEAEAFATMPEEATLAHLFRELDQPVSQLPVEGWNSAEYCLTGAPLSQSIAEGDCIDLGNRMLTVLHLPGHSIDSIALFEERTGMLFSGDALYDGELIDTFPSSNVEEYRATMLRLRGLDISVGHGGHGPSFNNARKNTLVDEYLAGSRQQGCPRSSL